MNRQQQERLNQMRRKALRRTLIIVAVICIPFYALYRCDENNLTKNQSNESSIEDNNGDDIPNKNESISEPEEPTTCSVCGKSFYGNGYEEQMDGSWKELSDDYQGTICSLSCGRKHAQQMNDIANKYGVDLEEENTNSLKDDGYHYGNDGRVYENKKCSLCKGTGVEKARNIATGDIEGRICPMCDGKGIRSY